MSVIWCEWAWLGSGEAIAGGETAGGGTGNGIQPGVRIETDAAGIITAVSTGTEPNPDRTELILDGVVFPGAANAHSHAFHRILRGRTHQGGGDFWIWREQMYKAAGELTPEKYEQLATAVYAEMVTAGFTSVAEFHYVHHRPDGTSYAQAPGTGTAPGTGAHAMERALARAAVAAGIRLTLLDTCYLAGGIGQPLSEAQQRFGDADVTAWLRRLDSLRETIAADFDPDLVRVGAALHSVRGVPEEALAVLAQRLPADIPLHIHLSEQPAENEACLARYGLTPTGLLARHGLLSERLSAVHATHLTDEDIALLGSAGATIVMCPTTEADLADGIGPARRLQDAGARIALGTDQHAVVDPWLEMRALEYGERLASGRRGRFGPAALLDAAGTGAEAAMATSTAAIRAGSPADLMAINPASPRTVGSHAEQLPLTATGADVTVVVVAGTPVARDGIHLRLGTPATLLGQALKEFS